MGRVIVAGGAPKMTVPSKPSNLPEIGTPLNDMTWADIRAISDAGLASSYFNVGDRKAVTLNGTVGSLSLNGTYYCYIIGIDHNSAIEGTNRVHFQLGKTALSGGTDVALCDSKYLNAGSDEAFRMNTESTNSSGWNNSYMRKTICPAFKNILPADLQNAIKSVTKYTNNTGASSEASAVTATTDEIFLLSEYEVTGTIANSNTNEASKQAQYAYYAAGNSNIKYNHSSTSTAVYWWLRSPFASNPMSFVNVFESGPVYGPASYSFGFAPAFCV